MNGVAGFFQTMLQPRHTSRQYPCKERAVRLDQFKALLELAFGDSIFHSFHQVRRHHGRPANIHQQPDHQTDKGEVNADEHPASDAGEKGS
jgi:hypothetical protein